MHHHPHIVTRPAQAKPSSTTAHDAPRWLLMAVALCGALAGGSIVEAIAALASHANTPVSPDHLIAEPLALAGAVCGGLLAAILASKEQRNSGGQAGATGETSATAEVIPGEPMLWQPAPLAMPDIQPFAPAEAPAPNSPSTHHAQQHLPRAIRQRGRSRHVIHTTVHTTLPRPPTQN